MKEQRGVLNLRFLGGSFAITMLCGTAVPVSSQEQIPGSADISVPFEEISNVSAEGIVNYPAAFFQKYQPNTALDMVRQIPGFRINNGGQSRGFGTSSGNILIDDRRPSTKQDGPVAILGRIPAARVERIELITTAVRDIDMQGLPAVANIHLKGEAPMAVRWQTSMGKNFEYDPLEMGGNISLSHSWKDVDYNTGFNLNRFIFSEFSTEELYDGDNVFTEQRLDDRITKGTRGSFNLNECVNLVGADLFSI